MPQTGIRCGTVGMCYPRVATSGCGNTAGPGCSGGDPLVGSLLDELGHLCCISHGEEKQPSKVCNKIVACCVMEHRNGD